MNKKEQLELLNEALGIINNANFQYEIDNGQVSIFTEEGNIVINNDGFLEIEE
jgi:hypothetical protein